MNYPIFKNPIEGALYWHQFGFDVIPIFPAIKVTAVKWDRWLNDLTLEAINKYWNAHPVHEVGFIVGNNKIVFDADSPEAIAALVQLEQAHGVTPNMVMQTTKGEHHYFLRAPGTIAKSDSHSTETYPDRIDIKTGRAMVVTSPSKGKVLKVFAVQSADELTVVGQDFIDAVFLHNGRGTPSNIIHAAAERDDDFEPSPGHMSMLNALVSMLDPDCGYEDWLHVGMAVFHESGGSDEGLALFDSWSQRGSKYAGTNDIETKWRSFKSSTSNPITIATLKMMVTQAGHDWLEVCAAAEPAFEACEGKVIATDIAVIQQDTFNTSANPLDKFSLRGMSQEIEAQVVEQVPVLGQLALKGQATALYAAPNTGKTLITLALLHNGITAGLIVPSKLYYLNVDDTANGIATKLRNADEFQYHMLSEGYRDFQVGALLGIMNEITEADQARDVIIVLDTLKKFTDLMDKTKASQFTKVARRFVLKGGTLIALAHTNKHPGRNGKPVYGGVSDILNDFDCAYTIDTVESGTDGGDKVVKFENIKRRGNVAMTAAYSYTTARNVSYDELLASVRLVDDTELAPLIQAAQVKSDAELIAIVSTCIGAGINTKMKLADEVSKRAGVSKRVAFQTIERYTGTDPAKHRWAFSLKERGAKVFELLDTPPLLTGNVSTG